MITPIASLITALLITLGFPIPTGSAEAQPANPPIIKITPEFAQAMVKGEAYERGWDGEEWTCLYTLIDFESRWNHEADNKHSSAYGLFQILKTPEDLALEEQIYRGFAYISTRYGSPCKALGFWYKQDRRGAPWY